MTELMTPMETHPGLTGLEQTILEELYIFLDRLPALELPTLV
jgi:hypothetical protein